MNGVLMSSVISDVLLRLREKLDFINTNQAFPQNLFNRGQMEIIALSECFQFDQAIRIAARVSEGSLTNVAVLAHDGASDFEVGETITGGTSGATAVVVTVNASTIHVKSVVGIFQNPEVITGGTSGDTANTTALIVAPTTRTIITVPANITVSTSDDFYNGYLAKNSTSKEEAFVTDSVASSGSEYQTLNLSRAMTSMVTGDTIELEKQAKFVELSWYIIRPFLSGGVHWGDQLLDPISLPDMKDSYGSSSANSTTGTPQVWAMENQKLWIYPQPTTTEILRIAGHRRPSNIVESTLTSNGSSRSDTLIDTTIPLKSNDYYRGMEILIKSGSANGEIQTIGEYDAGNSTYYFESPYSVQLDSGVKYEIISPLPEEYRGLLQDFISWHLTSGNRNFKQESDDYKRDYLAEIEKLRMIARRNYTSNASSRTDRGLRRPRGVSIVNTT